MCALPKRAAGITDREMGHVLGAALGEPRARELVGAPEGTVEEERIEPFGVRDDVVEVGDRGDIGRAMSLGVGSQSPTFCSGELSTTPSRCTGLLPLTGRAVIRARSIRCERRRWASRLPERAVAKSLGLRSVAVCA